jgi:cbb3-type cytochrome oxidase subunit 3
MNKDLIYSIITIGIFYLAFKLFMYWPRLFKKKKEREYPSATVVDLDDFEKKIS